MTLHPAIQSLTLQHNSLQEVGSASFQFHPELSLVDLAWNGLARIQDRTFEAQRRLTVLRLAGNQLTQLTSLTLYGLESLRLLDLASNLLASLPVGLFEATPNLEELYLADNRFQTVEPVPVLFSSLSLLKVYRYYIPVFNRSNMSSLPNVPVHEGSIATSAPEPDPQDPWVLWPPRSGSVNFFVKEPVPDPAILYFEKR
jgi:hypothetical protein